MRESTIEKKGVEWATANGWLTMKYTGERSYPDRIFIKDGVTVWVEFKTLDEAPSPAQNYRIRKLRGAGAKAYWTNSLDGLKLILNFYNDPTTRGTEPCINQSKID